MIIIDAKDSVLGRIAAYAAKKALLGEGVSVINCEEAVITGNKNFIMEKYVNRISRGTPRKGPFIPREPQMFVKRAIRGMLPYKKPRGKEALARIRCYVGVPEELKAKKAETVEDAHISRIRSQRFIYLKELCMLIGGIKSNQ